MKMDTVDFSGVKDLMAASPQNCLFIYWDGANARLIHDGDHARNLLDFDRNERLHRWLAATFARELPANETLSLEADGLPSDCRIVCKIQPLDNSAAVMIGVLTTASTQAAARELDADLEQKAPMSSEDRDRLESVIAALDDMVWLIDAHGRVRLRNPAFEKFIGLWGDKPVDGETDIAAFGILHDLMEENETGRKVPGSFVTERTVVHPETGAEILLEIRQSTVRNSSGAPDGFLYIGRDITRQKNLERELSASKNELIAHAYSDPLTGMPNRRHFVDEMERMLAGLCSSGGHGALLMIDLDHFSAVNDSVGHSAGDLLLVEMATRIRKVADAHDGYAARLNSDEFVVLIDQFADPDALARISEQILTAISEPFFSGSWVLTITASIGIALIPDHASAPDDLQKYADNAMYEAKRAGQNTWRIFDHSLIMEAQDRFELETDLHGGLYQDEFTSHFQAKIDLQTGEIAGVEALMRWNHPQRGSIPPAIFIPLAEETGLIVPLGEKILTEACHFARNWNDGSRRPARVAVNLSPRQVMFEDFLPLLKASLSRTGCKPEWLELEITENILLSDQRRIDELMQGLNSLGVRIAIDDFGTGYSAISYLTRYPIETLKIDRSFVHDIAWNRKNAVVVKAIVSMANGLGMKTIAEGIETPEEAAFMRKIGCAEGQGYLWHRPMPKDAFLQWAAKLQEEQAAQ